MFYAQTGEWTFNRKMTKTDRSRGLGRKTREEIGKVESNDSPEFPDKGKTSDIHGFPSGIHEWSLSVLFYKEMPQTEGRRGAGCVCVWVGESHHRLRTGRRCHRTLSPVLFRGRGDRSSWVWGCRSDDVVCACPYRT